MYKSHVIALFEIIFVIVLLYSLLMPYLIIKLFEHILISLPLLLFIKHLLIILFLVIVHYMIVDATLSIFLRVNCHVVVLLGVNHIIIIFVFLGLISKSLEIRLFNP